jgi:hypothetical protein
MLDYVVDTLRSATEELGGSTASTARTVRADGQSNEAL